MFMAAFPLCKFCWDKGLTVAGEVVDHIESIEDRPDLRLEWSNLQTLCKHCHDSVRQAQQAAERKARRQG